MILSEIIALPYRIGQDKYITNAVNCKKDEIKFDFNDLKKSLGNVSDYLSKHKSYIHPNSIIEKNVDIEGNVFIDEGVKIFSGVKLTGNIYIGKNSIIYNNAIVRGNTSIGDNSIIGFSTDIKNVLASSNFLVGPVCIICDSIIGSNCFFGGVCRTGNIRFDAREIRLGEFYNEIVKTIDLKDNELVLSAEVSVKGEDVFLGLGKKVGMTLKMKQKKMRMVNLQIKMALVKISKK